MEKKKKDLKLKRKQEKEKRRAQKEAKKAKKKDVRHTKNHPVLKLSNDRLKLVVLFFQTTNIKISLGMNGGKLFTGSGQQNGTALYMIGKPVNGLSNGAENWAYHHDADDSDSDMGSHGDDALTGRSPHADEEMRMTCGSGTHSIILDMSTSNFVDMVTVKTLKNVSVPAPVSLNRRCVRNDINKTQLSNSELFLEIIQEKLQSCFLSLRCSETLDRLIWTFI